MRLSRSKNKKRCDIFFFQAEDGIRDYKVTGVQTCALPISHIVDMHQLTKDPDQLLGGSGTATTSPQRTMTRFALSRYLDYCSELLSLTSKVAALYVQDSQDPVLLDAVNDVETLTTGLSRKIWQKIMIIDTLEPSRRLT